ncbi:MAG: hypothetical protein EOO38_25720 [Cytophagaceae bacterium]|nr:MAG: hypothetical protein EOO38_25720 [Cytophagaceae bacterium]
MSNATSPDQPSDTASAALPRNLTLLQGTALNMIDMVGIGPFVVLPLVLDDIEMGEVYERGRKRSTPNGSRIRRWQGQQRTCLCTDWSSLVSFTM